MLVREAMNVKKILLTGAGGFVGMRIAQHLQGRYELITFPKGVLSRADLSEIRAFAVNAAPHAIIHTAAIADMGVCEANPEDSWRSNVLLTETLCSAAQELRAKIVCYSSDQVYNGCDPLLGPYREDIPLTPVNVYGRHKLEAERRGLAACPDAVMLRATWMYDLTGESLQTRGGLLPNLLRQADENRTERFSSNDFRGITWVRQAAELTEKALDLPGGAYNFGSPNHLSMYDTVCAALSALGLPIHLAERDDSGRVRCLSMDQTKINAHGIVFDSTADGFIHCAKAFAD